MKSGLVLGSALLAAIVGAGCGESPLAPTPPGASPFATQFSGLWNGSLVLSNVSGGECVGADLARAAAVSPQTDLGTVSITQDNSDVTAVVRSTTSGLSCTYRGNASVASFALSAESCDAEVVLQCSNGATRLLEPIGSTMTVTQSGTTSSGIVTTSYNMFSNDEKRTPVAGLTTQHQFTATRR